MPKMRIRAPFNPLLKRRSSSSASRAMLRTFFEQLFEFPAAAHVISATPRYLASETNQFRKCLRSYQFEIHSWNAVSDVPARDVSLASDPQRARARSRHQKGS